MAWKILLCILFGYAVGNINPAYIIGRLRGIDVRKSGSGNAGASNALILMGKLAGLVSALFDIFKAAAVMWLAPVIFGGVPCIAEIAGVACAVGHIYPVAMKFKGGKGLACLGGILLAVDWRLLLILLGIEIVIVLVVNYICIVPITASIVLPILYGVLGDMGAGWLLRADGGVAAILILSGLALIMLFKHLQNIYRIATGTEMRFNYLWIKDKAGERARVEQNRERLMQKKAERMAARKESNV